MFSMTGLRYMEPKFIQSINHNTLSKSKPDSWKMEIPKPTPTSSVKKDQENKQNKPPEEPKKVVVSKKIPAVFTKVRGFHNIGNTCYL